MSDEQTTCNYAVDSNGCVRQDAEIDVTPHRDGIDITVAGVADISLSSIQAAELARSLNEAARAHAWAILGITGD